MFNPIQIKHECIGVEDINSDGRINTSMFITENDYKYNQLPQFWGHAQLSTEIQPKTEIDGQHSLFQTEENETLAYMRANYVQNGMIFQINQEGSTSLCHTNQQCHLNIAPKVQQPQAPQDTQQTKLANQMLAISESIPSMKSNRPGRPAKGSSDASVERKVKCQCEICFKEFGHKSNLFIHMRTHNGERPYKCNQCEKCFTHSGNLAIHMRTHSGERPYGCQICGKTFSHSGNLSTHLRTHSGVKPYKCSICGKEFRHSGNLSIHERIHSGIKPFQCKICGKDFYHSGNLTTHMKKHTVYTNSNVGRCENNARQAICPAVNLNNIAPSSSFNNLTSSPTTDIKLMPDANSIVPIKNEINDGLTSAIEI